MGFWVAGLTGLARALFATFAQNSHSPVRPCFASRPAESTRSEAARIPSERECKPILAIVPRLVGQGLPNNDA